MTSALPFPIRAADFPNVEYGRAGDFSLRMDGRTPDGDSPRPAVILVHGGGWVRGDRVYNVKPLFQPLEEAGYAWFSISYRLAADVTQFGVAAQDVQAAIRHIRLNAQKYRIDPDRIVVLGESAGAHLASLAALAEPGSVAGVISLYGPMDLVQLAQTSSLVPPQIRDALTNSVFGPLMAAHLRSLSPASQVRPGAPPFLLVHGTSDSVVPISQSRLMQERLQTAGVPCDLVTVPGGGHGLRYWNGAAQAVWHADLLRWLDRTLSVRRL